MQARQPYSGDRRRLVLGIDVGITYSRVSYAILSPGQVPEIRGVNRYPAYSMVGGDSKIPTIMYYDAAGTLKACGAEALEPELQIQATAEGWLKSEWFKLHLRPKEIAETTGFAPPPLPLNKTIVDLFADFYRYLMDCARTYIEETHRALLWESVERDITFIIAHPNGWEGPQQTLLRNAAVQAGLIQNTYADHARLDFITEGEASLNYCITEGLLTDRMKTGEGALVVDAGTGTVDLSAYLVALESKRFKEIAPASCLFHGSVFVTHRAHQYLTAALKGSQFEADIDSITSLFDKSAKLTFRGSASYMKFGSGRDNDPARNIRSGMMTIQGTIVENFFRPSLEAILSAITAVRNVALHKISVIYLVGGFAASDWLYKALQTELSKLSLTVFRPDHHMNKAVVNGSVSCFLDRFVSKRVARFTLGTNAMRAYDPDDPEHRSRHRLMQVRLTGEKMLKGCFSPILTKGTQILDTAEYRRTYSLEAGVGKIGRRKLKEVSASIMAYRGNNEDPKWMDVDAENYSTLCEVQANISGAPKMVLHNNQTKQDLRVFNYDIILSFGPAELKAQVAWKEGGVEKRGPAKIVYAE